MAMQRKIGLVGLTFVAVSGVLGSGWLFAPLLTSQLAGPGALIAWLIGAVAMMLLALALAEFATLFPVAGGIARMPQFSHGRLLAMLVGWTAWAGYCTTAPIEVEASLTYASEWLPWIHKNPNGGMTLPGQITAMVLLALFTVVNAFGVKWFARINTTITWFKLVVPVIIIVMLIADRFDGANFTQYGGFLPYGMSGVFAAVASGGVVFAFVGFRHAVDMAGETINPQRTIPLALIGAVLICLFVYGGLQIAFMGAVDSSDFTAGWNSLSFDSDLGPLGALAAALGILWMVSLLNVAAVVAPMGGGLVSTGSNGRLAMAMANNGVFPAIFAKLNVYGVPLWALILNFFVSLVMMFTMPFTEIVALNGAAIILSFVSGPISVIALRSLASDYERPFRLPAAGVLAPAGFVIASLMVYWSGWDTTWRLMILLALGLVLFFIRLAFIGREDLHPRGVIWFGPYLLGMAVMSYLGVYGGGIAAIPSPWDSLIVSAGALGIFYIAVRDRVSQAQFDSFIAEEHRLQIEEYGTEEGLEGFKKIG
ncbi:APC family permease [Chachezhania antarctica]|uniref:APC family permease n=1 Tax=Chachezhania antarctica TaxID=2340860 RepID=UPI000EB2FA6F|nr:APC family permease [Chachezhania antarctica]